MPAYFIVENEVADPKQGSRSIGSRFRAPSRSTAVGRRWYDSEEYRALKALRLRTAKGSVVLVEGV